MCMVATTSMKIVHILPCFKFSDVLLTQGLNYIILDVLFMRFLFSLSACFFVLRRRKTDIRVIMFVCFL